MIGIVSPLPVCTLKAWTEAFRVLPLLQWAQPYNIDIYLFIIYVFIYLLCIYLFMYVCMYLFIYLFYWIFCFVRDLPVNRTTYSYIVFSIRC
jgi:hypothetical protein